MKIINRYGPCVGVTLFRFRRLNIELWYCPANYTIVEHKHPSMDIELVLLFGWTTFMRRERKSDVQQCAAAKFPFHACKKYTVPAGWFHSFSTGKVPLVFINVEKWKPNIKITSAAEDFQIAN